MQSLRDLSHLEIGKQTLGSWFEIWAERVCKDTVKAFPKGLCGHKTAEKRCSWAPRLPGITNPFE